MVSQSSVEESSSLSATLNFASILLPTDEYSTLVTSFPGSNCGSGWGRSGVFSLQFKVYHQGSFVGTIGTQETNEQGCLRADFDTVASLCEKPLDGIIVSSYSHTKLVPVELYYSHFQRKTGAYIAYPALPFMGDEIYTSTHVDQLENTVFWPGLVATPETECSLVVINPYKLSYSYQVTVFLDDGSRIQSEVFKVKPYSRRVHPVDQTFPEQYQKILNFKGQASLCVSAQYKVIGYVMFKDRESDSITTIDHLHSYCMY